MVHFSAEILPLRNDTPVPNGMFHDAFITTDQMLTDEQICAAHLWLARKYGFFVPELFDDFAQQFDPLD
jgi:hypothetical protein